MMRITRYLLGGTAFIAAAQAHAQTAQPASQATPSATNQTAPDTNDSGLADIVVTAQKRSENLQTTPIAITALSAETIKDKGITSVGDLTAIAPSVSITASTASATIVQVFIRGIGEVDPILTSDSPVGLYVDGVILGRTAGAAFDVVDLERIEVLRGPQGTLYGRNTIGGAINLISAKPSDQFGVELNAGAGNYGLLQTKASVDTGDIGGTGLSGRFTYMHRQRNGFVDDPTTRSNKDPSAFDLDAFRAALRFRRGGFTLDYAFDHSDRTSYAAAFQLTAVRPDVLAYLQASPGLGGKAPQIFPTRQSRYDVNQGAISDKVWGHSISAELDLGGITLRSITGFRSWRNNNRRDDFNGAGLVGFTVSPAILAPPNPFIPLGVNPIDLIITSNERRQNQFSQEINILGKIGPRFEYVLGGYYFREHSVETNPQNILLVLPSPVPITLTPTATINSFGVPISTLLDYDHYSKSKAAFAQGTFEVTPTLSIMGGVRYTDDDKRLVQRSPLTRTLTGSFDKFNYAASINWQATPDLLVYGRTATGYKSGGFNARSINSGYQPESLTSYEAGIKSDLFDRRLRLNVTAFYAKHTDLQLQQLQAGSGGATSVTVNAGKARYWGLEGELTARPVRSVTIGANVGYTNRKYLQFVILDPATNQFIDVKDTAHFPVGATTTVSAFAQWDVVETPFGKLSLRGDYDYRGKIYYNPTSVGAPFNDIVAGGPRSLVGARLSLTDIDLNGATGEIALWGKNILNEKYRQYGIDFGGLGFAGNTYGDPATVGVDFRLKL